jgi:hypothetical protein
VDEGRDALKELIMTRRSVRTIGALAAAIAMTLMMETPAHSCPVELTQTKAAIEHVPATEMTEQQLPRGQDIQEPDSQAIRSPGGQEIQARGQEFRRPVVRRFTPRPQSWE